MADIKFQSPFNPHGFAVWNFKEAQAKAFEKSLKKVVQKTITVSRKLQPMPEPSRKCVNGRYEEVRECGCKK